MRRSSASPLLQERSRVCAGEVFAFLLRVPSPNLCCTGRVPRDFSHLGFPLVTLVTLVTNVAGAGDAHGCANGAGRMDALERRSAGTASRERVT